MSKLPTLSARKVVKILKKKGFVLDRTKGSHRIYLHPETGRRVVVLFTNVISPREPYWKYYARQAFEKTS